MCQRTWNSDTVLDVIEKRGMAGSDWKKGPEGSRMQGKANVGTWVVVLVRWAYGVQMSDAPSTLESFVYGHKELKSDLILKRGSG